MQHQTAIIMADHPPAAPASQLADGTARHGTRGFRTFGRATARGVAALALALSVLGPSVQGQTLRVTSWNLEPPNVARTNGAAAATNDISIPAAAKALKQLQPDVILLQQARDWNTCEKLAQALKPAKYNVAVCSAFRDARTGTLRKQQVAILAKAKAYSSWSEPWRNRGVPPLPGGFAFAAFQVGKQRVGLFSVQTGAGQAGAAKKQQKGASPAPTVVPLSPASAVWLAVERATTSPPARQPERLAAAYEQLLEHVGSVSNWVANRVQVFVIGSTLGLAPAQEPGAYRPRVTLAAGGQFRGRLPGYPRRKKSHGARKAPAGWHHR